MESIRQPAPLCRLLPCLSRLQAANHACLSLEALRSRHVSSQGHPSRSEPSTLFSSFGMEQVWRKRCFFKRGKGFNFNGRLASKRFRSGFFPLQQNLIPFIYTLYDFLWKKIKISEAEVRKKSGKFRFKKVWNFFGTITLTPKKFHTFSLILSREKISSSLVCIWWSVARDSNPRLALTVLPSAWFFSSFS